MLTLRSARFAVKPSALVAAVLLSAAALGVTSPAQAADWPRFRGPDLDGISRETDWQSETEPKVAWKAEVGLGHASFVVAGDRVLTTGHDGKNTDTVYCFDAGDGTVVWKHSYEHPLDDLYYPGGTTGTPTIDGDVVYHVARRGQLFCFDLADGTVKWQLHLTNDLGYDMPTWGFTGSPLIDGDRLFLTAGDAGLALNRHDGSVIWKSENGEAGYSTPCPLTREGKQLLIFSNKRGYVCVDATDGTETWRVKWLTRYGVNAAMPVVSGDLLLISSGYGKGGTLLRFPDDKAATAPEEVWRSRDLATQMNAALLVDEHVYGIHGNESVDQTGLKCLHLESGATRWTEPSVGHGAALIADGRLIVLSEKGELLIAPVSPEAFEPTVRLQVLDEKCWTVPVLANGRIYCRNDKGAVVVLEVSEAP